MPLDPQIKTSGGGLYPGTLESAPMAFPIGGNKIPTVGGIDPQEIFDEGWETGETASVYNRATGAWVGVLDQNGVPQPVALQVLTSFIIVDAITTAVPSILNGIRLGSVIYAKTRSTLGDGGGGVFNIEASGTPDGGTSFFLGNGLYANRPISGFVDPRWWGAAGKGEVATAAWQAAIDKAAGLPIEVYGGSYILGLLNCNNKTTRFKFKGPTTVNVVSGANLFQAVQDFQEITSVASISTGVATVEGVSVTTVSILNFATAPNWVKGQVVRVVSDDLEPNTVTSTTARMGEYATVLYTSGNVIYLAGLLEYAYATNIRAGKIQGTTFESEGPLTVESSQANTAPIVALEGNFRPKITGGFKARNHGDTAIYSVGSFMGEFSDLTFENLRNSSAGVGYGFNDQGGCENQVNRPVARGVRHCTTTTISNVTAGSTRLAQFGATVDHTVRDGCTNYAEATCYDSHEASRRTRWINCFGDNVVQGYSGAATVIQTRGIDEQAISCSSGPRVAALVAANATAQRFRLTDPQSDAQRLMSVVPLTGADKRIWINGGVVRGTSPSLIIATGAADIRVTGTKFVHTVSVASTQTFDIGDGASLILTGGVQIEVVGIGTPASHRTFRTNGTASIEAVYNISYSGLTPAFVVLAQTGTCALKLKSKSSVGVAMNSGTLAAGSKYLQSYPAGTVDNIADFADYKLNLATLV